MNTRSMSKSFFIITACFLLVRCGSMFEPKADPTRFFVLSPMPEGDVPSADAIHCKGLILGVGIVELPPYLNTQKIVTFSSTDEVVLSEFSRWAEPLDRGFVRVFALNLQQLTGVQQVEAYPWMQRDDNDLEVFTEVHSFEAMPDGRVDLRVSWRITTSRSTCLLASGSDTFVARSDGSYPSIVTAMSTAVGLYSEAVARDLATAAKAKLKFDLACAEKMKTALEGEDSTSEAASSAASDKKKSCGGCPDSVE